jgi:RNA-binding protein
MNLSEHQKKYLRGLGHQLKPLIMVGEAGLSESLMAEFESTLEHHELLKVRVRVGDRETRDAIIAQLCADGDAQLIQRIGNVALLYRPNLKKKPEKRIRIPERRDYS